MQNFFSLFSLDETFKLNLDTLETKYFELQSKYHPDKAMSNADKQEYISQSILINNAYDILRNDFKRAMHILELHGINLTDEDHAYKLPPETLENILEIRENIEQLLSTKSENLSYLVYKLQIERSELLLAISTALDTQNYTATALHTMKLKYIDNALAVAKS